MNHRTSLAMLRALIAGSLGGMILAMLCGCTTTKQYTYPDGFKDFFSASRKSAVAAIARVDGKQPKLNERCRYETKAGTRKYSGMWCWQSPERAAMERTTYSPPLGPLVVEIGNDAWCAERWGVDSFWRGDCLADLGIIRLRGTRRDGRLLPTADGLGHETGHLLWPELPEEVLK
jgi:hypothetical protein